MAAMTSFCSRLIIPRICVRTSLSTSVMLLSSLSHTGSVIRSFPRLPLRCPRSYYYVKPKEKKGPSFKSWLIFGAGCVAVATGAIIYVGKTFFILFYNVSHENVWVKITSPSCTWWICGSPPSLPLPHQRTMQPVVRISFLKIVTLFELNRLFCERFWQNFNPKDHSWGKRFGYRIKWTNGCFEVVDLWMKGVKCSWKKDVHIDSFYSFVIKRGLRGGCCTIL